MAAIIHNGSGPTAHHLEEPLLHKGAKKLGASLQTTFSAPVCVLALLLVAGFAAFTDYTDSKATDQHIGQYYMWYIHVVIMIFVGFGWLMTFLRRYSYSAVALNMFTSALVMLEFVLIGGAVQQLWTEEGIKFAKIELDMPLLIDAAFCAGAAMITFGAVLGKVTPTQLTMLLVLEVPVYAVNQKLVFDLIKGLDIGGSMSIHAFGAYYGLVASLILSKVGSGTGHPKNGASYTSDMTAMVGTVFLWIFWPSFNGALASNPDLADLPVQTQFYCVTNTVISLLGAVVVTFAASALFDGGKFNMVHIQNATLAGGVAVGSSANLKILPGGALTIGMIAGLLSTLGYVYITPALEKGIGLRDTCGVHNLHGMPGVMGGLAAAVASLAAYSGNSAVLDLYHGSSTYLYQLGALLCSIGMACLGGAVAAGLVKLTTPASQVLEGADLFEDALYWHEVESEDGEGHEHPSADTDKPANTLAYLNA